MNIIEQAKEVNNLFNEINNKKKKCSTCLGRKKETCIIDKITIDGMKLIRDKNFYCSNYESNTIDFDKI